MFNKAELNVWIKKNKWCYGVQLNLNSLHQFSITNGIYATKCWIRWFKLDSDALLSCWIQRSNKKSRTRLIMMLKILNITFQTIIKFKLSVRVQKWPKVLNRMFLLNALSCFKILNRTFWKWGCCSKRVNQMFQMELWCKNVLNWTFKT